jgi:hypothetical protein
LEGYANLEHWVADLDKRIEGILMQRLAHIIQVWCSEFDKTEDAINLISPTKRRSDKRHFKEEKVCIPLSL